VTYVRLDVKAERLPGAAMITVFSRYRLVTRCVIVRGMGTFDDLGPGMGIFEDLGAGHGHL